MQKNQIICAREKVNKVNAVVRTYSWGPEAQGVPGTLRMIADNNGVYFPAYDPNGNVMGLVKASDGTVCAQYEYLPYGELVTATGTMAGSNPIRFSTKYRDNETGLYYYGYRYYSPDMGRWLSRDPIEEQGGLNLYGFVNNDPVNKWDKLGMSYVCSKYEVWKEEYKKFTKSEKIWFIIHPCCAFSVRNSKTVIMSEISKRYSRGPDNTVVNAIQHCALMCYVASMFWCSKDDALALGRAHEDRGDNPEHDMAMDLFNNAVGVSVGGTDLKSCFDKCEAKAKSYELYWWKPLGSGVDKKNLPSDFPGFTLSPDGRIIGGNIGDSSPTSPNFSISLNKSKK